MKNSMLKKLLYPTKDKILLFLILFGAVHALNAGLIFLIGGFWDAGLSIGFPSPFYVINCGLIGDGCNYGFHITGLLVDVLLWYVIAALFRRKKQNAK